MGQKRREEEEEYNGNKDRGGMTWTRARSRAHSWDEGNNKENSSISLVYLGGGQGRNGVEVVQVEK